MARHKSTHFLQSASAGQHTADGDRPQSGGGIEMRPSVRVRKSFTPFPMKRRIRYGMVGGGRGAFIGAVHRIAAAIDQQIELVCGAFSSDPDRSRASGADLFLAPERCYGTFEEMIRSEASLPEDIRADFIAIVTPNHMHFPPT